MEDIGTVDDGERREVPAERPSANRDPVEVELGEGVRDRVKADHLVLEYGTGEVTSHRALPRRCSRRPAPVDDNDGEPLVGEPLGLAKRSLVVGDAGVVRATVGVHQDR